MVVIVADHGGFVGMDYTLECKIKQSDPGIIKSIFTSALAIKWPDAKPPSFDDRLRTNVNLFRILFAYLGEKESLLQNLQPDTSFSVIESEAPFGVYQYINAEGEIVFNKYESDRWFITQKIVF